MNEMELRRLVREAALQTVKRYLTQENEVPHETVRTVLLIPGSVPFANLAAELLDQYPGGKIALAFDETCSVGMLPCLNACAENREAALQKVMEAEKIILLAPTLQMISDLARGKDSQMAEYLFLHASLWGKRVEIWMDFECAGYRRLFPASTLGEDVDTLSAMGISWKCYCRQPVKKKEKPSSLLTEEDMLLIVQSGQKELFVEKGMMVTPLAKDAARRAGLRLRIREVK